mgnify:CR=1 FL=1
MVVVDEFSRKMWVYFPRRRLTLLASSEDGRSLSSGNIERWRRSYALMEVENYDR